MPGKKAIYGVPMTPAQRRAKSDADRTARGEQRRTIWLTPEAVAALNKVTGPDRSRAGIQDAVNEAVIGYATGWLSDEALKVIYDMAGPDCTHEQLQAAMNEAIVGFGRRR
ncbi:hypothetical protein PQR05_29360 [Paraburkholderia sediminicola]|uniref:hypothetical protein n=1 Tax=Paraburkholderia sediminicola TaxID=458836 RepID=UPI0038BA799A